MLVRKQFLLQADGGAGGSAGGEGDKGGEGTTTSTTSTQSTTTGDKVDLTKLSGDQLATIMEGQEFWNLPRMKSLREKAAQADKLIKDQSAAEEKALADQKKFEELANKRGTDLTEAQKQIQNMKIDQALTNALVKENVVDLDGGLKLADRSKVKIAEDGTISGVEDALNALKTDKGYLFKAGSSTTTSIGTATNANNGGGDTGSAKFKRSQITPAFYAENAKEINQAYAAGLVEDDGPAPQQ